MEGVEFAGFGGVRIACDTFGSPDAPPVLLIPSGGQTKEFWHGSAQALAQAGRYAICVDLRGHGDSGHAADGRYDLDAYVQDLRAILAALPNRSHIVATGLGAIIALAAVGESDPHVVSGLSLMDFNIWVEESELKRQHASLLERTMGAGAPGQLADAIAAAHPNEPAPKDAGRLLKAFTRQEDGTLEWRGDPLALKYGSLIGMQDRLTAAASRTVSPVLLIRGSLNTSISNEIMQRLQATIPGAEIAEIEGAGHLMAADREDAFNSIVLEFLERHSPLQPLNYIGGSEPRVLRDALGCFGTGVTVVTTMNGAGEPIGLTANSFTSVSLDPPLILFSLARRSANLGVFTDAERFAINVLHIGQQPLANRFARRDASRFDGVDWSIRSEQGSPILGGTLASFDCRKYAVQEGGDHLIFIGQVDHAWFEPYRDPLLYFRGKYRRLHFS